MTRRDCQLEDNNYVKLFFYIIFILFLQKSAKMTRRDCQLEDNIRHCKNMFYKNYSSFCLFVSSQILNYYYHRLIKIMLTTGFTTETYMTFLYVGSQMSYFLHLGLVHQVYNIIIWPHTIPESYWGRGNHMT